MFTKINSFTTHPAIGKSLALILDSPHSGTHYPNDFLFSAPLMSLRDAEDTGVEQLFNFAPTMGAALLEAHFPRSYIDVNRSVDDMDLQLLDGQWPRLVDASKKTELGKGLIWRLLDDGTPIYDRNLTPQEVEQRIALCYRPYWKKLEEMVREVQTQFGAAWHINCHSMPSVAGKFATDQPGVVHPDFVLGDRHGTTCDRAFTETIRSFLATEGFHVTVNTPYAGVEIVRRIGNPSAGRHSIQIEINRALYLNEKTREFTVNYTTLQKILKRMIEHVSTFIESEIKHSVTSA
jgi:N-formylglutamate deformylase